MQAMILAAGFGTRLLPHTRLRPKPMFPVLNEPLLLVTIRRLQRCGFDHILVNCHHLAEQIVEAVAPIDGVIVQVEEKILGTGGGLRRALSQMRDEPLLVTNGDIYHTIDYLELYRAHRKADTDVTLAMHDYSRFNSVPVVGERVVGFADPAWEGLKLAFTGLSVIEPQAVASIEDGRMSCIIDHYRHELKLGLRIGVHRTDDSFWTDMGTQEDYLALHAGLLQKKIPCWTEFAAGNSGPVLISDKARFSANSRFEPWCVIGAAAGEDIHLANCVVWDGVSLPKGWTARNRVISAFPELH